MKIRTIYLYKKGIALICYSFFTNSLSNKSSTTTYTYRNKIIYLFSFSALTLFHKITFNSYLYNLKLLLNISLYTISLKVSLVKIKTKYYNKNMWNYNIYWGDFYDSKKIKRKNFFQKIYERIYINITLWNSFLFHFWS